MTCEARPTPHTFQKKKFIFVQRIETVSSTMANSNNNMCMQDLQRDSSRCLVAGANGELFANYDCIVERLDGGSMEKSCRSLVAKTADGKNQHDFYTIDRKSSSPRLQSCQAEYENCCAENNHANLFDSPDGFANGKRPVCRMQRKYTGATLQNRGINGAMQVHEHGRIDQLSAFHFERDRPRYTWDGKKRDASNIEGCVYGEGGIGNGNQCDVSAGSMQCNQNLNLCAMDHVFVPLNAGARVPGRVERHVSVRRQDLKRSFPEERNPLRQNYVRYLASVEDESQNRYDMFQHSFNPLNSKVSDGDFGAVQNDDILYSQHLVEYLQAPSSERQKLRGLLRSNDLKQLSGLKDSDDKLLVQYLRGNPDQQQKLFDGNKSLQPIFRAFSAQAKTLKDYIGSSDPMDLAQRGEFNLVYQLANKNCSQDYSSLDTSDGVGQTKAEYMSACGVSVKSAKSYLQEFDNAFGAQKGKAIRQEIEQSVQKENGPYKPPKRLPAIANSAYNSIKDPEGTDEMAFWADQVLP